MQSHGTDEELERYVLGQLTEIEIQALEEHLLVCEACQLRVDEAEAFAYGMRDALSKEPLVSSRAQEPARDWFAWLRRPAVPLAAGLLAVIVVIAMLSGGRSRVAPVATLQLFAVRADVPVVGEARETDLQLADSPPGADFEAELLTSTGDKVWKGRTDRTGTLKVPQRLAPGSYLVRLKTPSGETLREYGFRVGP